MDSPNSQFPAEVEYRDLDRGTPAWAVKPGPAAIPAIPLIPGDIVNEETFEGTLWTQFFLVSNSGWFVTSADSHGGTKSFESADVGGPVVSSFVFNDFSFSEQLSFWIKADVVPSAGDVFEVLFDSVPVYTLTTDLPSWTRIAIPLNFAFNIEFRFTQNFFSSSPFVRVDDIVAGSFDTPGVPGSPAHPLVYTPLKMTDDGERLKVDAVSSGPTEVTQGTSPWVVSGTVDIGTIPEVEIKNDVGSPVPVSGTVTANQGTSPWVVSGTVTHSGGTLTNGAETAVAAAAVQVIAANASRKKLIVQNTGLGDVRVGVSGVTATTGVRLIRNGSIIFDMPDCPTQAIFAIRDGAVSSTVLAQEVA